MRTLTGARLEAFGSRAPRAWHRNEQRSCERGRRRDHVGTRSRHPPAPLSRVTSLAPPHSGRPSPDTRYFANSPPAKKMPHCDACKRRRHVHPHNVSASSFESKLQSEDGSALDGAFPALGSRAAGPLWRRVRDEVVERRRFTGLPAPVSSARSPDNRPAPSSADLRFPVPSFIV